MKNLAINTFKWDGLPDTVDERFLELILFDKGYAVYFDDEVLGNLALMCTIGGPLNVYNIPTMVTAFASNGYNRPLINGVDAVLIFNNYLHTPSVLTVELFARRIYEIERAIDVNVKGQKTPKIIKSTEQQRLTMQNLFMQYDGNEPFIFGDKNMDLNLMDVLDVTAPYVADKLIVLKHQIWNEFLTFCGIENSNQDKRERLVADEVGSNYGEVEAERIVMLNSRRQAADKINAMFGTNISVNFNSNLDTNVNRAFNADIVSLNEGGDANE